MKKEMKFGILLIFLIELTRGFEDVSLWNWNQNLSTRTVFHDMLPTERTMNTDNYGSACGNGNNDAEKGYACPHMMMFSPDMIFASMYDGLYDQFFYATAGTSNDDDCGKCFQVRLYDAERVWNDSLSKRHLIVQSINSGFDVMSGQFDIFMGAGGFGYFTACNNDCQTKFCQGGSCSESLYSSSFDDWNRPHFQDPNPCYSGGIKWLDETPSERIKESCLGLTNSDVTEYKNYVLVRSCFLSNTLLYHQNFVNTDYLRIRCPDGLTRLTGLKRNDEENLPSPHLENVFPSSCKGSRENGHYCATTMQDCCKPSCSWSGKGIPHPQWPKIDTCDKNGIPFL